MFSTLHGLANTDSVKYNFFVENLKPNFFRRILLNFQQDFYQYKCADICEMSMSVGTMTFPDWSGCKLLLGQNYIIMIIIIVNSRFFNSNHNIFLSTQEIYWAKLMAQSIGRIPLLMDNWFLCWKISVKPHAKKSTENAQKIQYDRKCFF